MPTKRFSKEQIKEHAKLTNEKKLASPSTSEPHQVSEPQTLKLFGVELETQDPEDAPKRWWYPVGTFCDLDCQPATGVEMLESNENKPCSDFRYKAFYRYRSLSVASGKGATPQEAEANLLLDINAIQRDLYALTTSLIVYPKTNKEIATDALATARKAVMEGRDFDATDTIAECLDSLLRQPAYYPVCLILSGLDTDFFPPTVLTAALMLTQTMPETAARAEFLACVEKSLLTTWKQSPELVAETIARLK